MAEGVAAIQAEAEVREAVKCMRDLVAAFGLSWDEDVAERFAIREIDKCVCDMRRFMVWDNSDHTESMAHVGRLNYLDLGHMAVADKLRQERAAAVTVQGEDRREKDQ